MRAKKVKALRKKLGLKLPIQKDWRQGKKVLKNVYLEDKSGNIKYFPNIERVTIINAAKYQYRQIKKMIQRMG